MAEHKEVDHGVEALGLERELRCVGALERRVRNALPRPLDLLPRDVDPKQPVFGTIFEVQIGRDARKQFTWPVYAVVARARYFPGIWDTNLVDGVSGQNVYVISVTGAALSRVTVTPWDLSRAISSSSACGSSTTPLPITESLLGRTTPDGNNESL
jgi:hypothetical protein